MESIYFIVFSDDTKFIGGKDYINPRWLEISPKKIAQLYYRFPNGEVKCFDKFDKYYHYVEATLDFSGGNKGQQHLVKAILLCLSYNLVKKYTIDLQSSNVKEENLMADCEEIQKLNPAGWR